MSLGAWGDEGNVCNCAEDTAMFQEYTHLAEAANNWFRNFDHEFPNDELRVKFLTVLDAIHSYSDTLKEGLTP